MINGVNGTLGDGAFNGWASVDIASKPLVKVDLDFQRLAIPLAKSPDGAAGQPWSNAPIDVSGLNYVDAQIRVSADETVIGDARLAPLALDAKLAGGILKVGTANLGAYGGQVSGEVILDATSGAPSLCDAFRPRRRARAAAAAEALPNSTRSTASCRPNSRCAAPAPASAR